MKIKPNKNIARIGNKEKVIVDVVSEEGWSLARSYRDAPEIDNYVKINKKLVKGKIYKILHGPFKGINGIFHQTLNNKNFILILKILGNDIHLKLPKSYIAVC